jgi:hypothetical protein
MEYWSNGKTLGKQSKVFSYALPTLQYSSTPVLQYSITPVLQVPRSDDGGDKIKSETVLERVTRSCPIL